MSSTRLLPWLLGAAMCLMVVVFLLSATVRAADMPEISKEFTPSQVFEHGFTTLTFTITNDDDLGEWNWSFTDNLPNGVTVANPNGVSISCENGTVTAPAGGSSIEVSGTMLTGQTDCTASVHVTSTVSGTYQNCENNFTDLVNIYAPTDCAELTCTPYNEDGLPDFFVNCDSVEAPEQFDFTIQEGWSTGAITQAYQTPVVGDLFGTGEPIAVIAANNDNAQGTSVPNRRSKDLHIVRASDGAVLNTITTPVFSWSGHAVVAIADLDGDGQGEIVLKTWHHSNAPEAERGRLYAYRNDGTLMWISNERYDYNEAQGRAGASLSVADFNADGTPEVYVGNQIFNGATGERLVAGTSAESAGCPYRANFGCFWSQTTAADMDNDGQLELVAGNVVYKVNITNTSGEAGNSLDIWQQADAAVDGVGDGWTAVADIDLDGTPDVIVVRSANNSQTGQTRLYVWNGQTSEVMSMVSGIGTGGGTPLIGDIDGDGGAEVVIQNGNLRAFKYETGVGFTPKWNINTNDSSALTSLSMFDFNSDGSQELVYRDETHLRIIDGDTAADRATFPCQSSTGSEMPVIADIDGTREARILVTCGVTNTASSSALRAFEAATDPWANTRPVWNQQAYFAAHINNDLSVPAPQAEHWIPFEDPSQQCSDGLHRPMNSFQQQMTDLDPNTGCPVTCVPPLDFGDAPSSYSSLREEDGARHLVPLYNDTAHTAPLMLGQLVDTEREGFPSVAADGDDNDNIDDEDGVANPIYFSAGEPTSVEVFVTNNRSEEATLAGWLDRDGTGTFDAGDRAPLLTIPANTSGTFTVEFPAGSAIDDTFARFRLYAGTVTDPQPIGYVTSGEVEDYQVFVGSVRYEKTVSPQDVTELQPGETFTYTITAENTGNAPLPGLTFTDDLSTVIDDATYQNDVNATIGTATFNAPDEMAWQGDLAPGQTATITYSVQVNSPLSGDGIMINGVVGDGPGSNCTDDPAIDPDCRTRLPLPDISSEKTLVSPDSPDAGDVVTYRFTMTNNSDEPAPSIVVADDLTGVLDDAAYNDDASVDVGAVTYNAVTGRLNWIGDLAANGQPGDTATITYTVTVNDATSLGDGILQNALISTDCPNPPILDPSNPSFDPSCATVDPVNAWLARKTIIPGSFEPGGTMSYRVDIENVGAADLSGVSVTDNLANVIDDATYNNDATATAGTATFTPPESIQWNGDLAAGASATMTYSFTINNPENQGNHMVINTIAGSPNCPSPAVTDPEDPNFNADCVTLTPLQFEDGSDEPGVSDSPSDGVLSETGRNILTYILIAGALVTTGLAVIFRKRLIALARR